MTCVTSVVLGLLVCFFSFAYLEQQRQDGFTLVWIWIRSDFDLVARYGTSRGGAGLLRSLALLSFPALRSVLSGVTAATELPAAASMEGRFLFAMELV